MTKTYSNKALPAGTVLREWRLEEVLGVGGFGIVYKGRGIYFNELVAIKEYFPSSISERDEEDTVVPIDSDAEEVHALGLKKFVEEAKLLWNLSTPSRHPNIVNVRSLFEVHGTAYMVMDFEDGVSLSKQLKEGKKFNERSLMDLVRPIAEGLDRAHRVGVLHRDIKPPNILINEDGKPVLIDFGSARFETGDATSTKVTFHTPPYAAIEQYVKTYPQGPWTDIYALGVVLYECITGGKPPEVLERMHGGMGTALSEGKWPGYSKRFLGAVDAAMTIRPSERPQSIAEWLNMFDGAEMPSKTDAVEVDDEATRFVKFDTAADQIIPVAPAPPGFAPGAPIDTGVPADPADAKFKRVGEDTNARDTRHPLPAADKDAAPSSATPDKPEPKKESGRAKGRPRTPVLVGGAAIAFLTMGAAWAVLTRSADEAAQSPGVVTETPVSVAQSGTLTSIHALSLHTRSLSDEGRTAGVGNTAVQGLAAASTALAEDYRQLETIAADPGRSSAVESGMAQTRQRAVAAHAAFAAALLNDAEQKARRLAADVPWADPSRPNAARAQPPDRQSAAAEVRNRLAELRSTAQGISAMTDPGQSLAAARDMLSRWQRFGASSVAAYSRNASAPREEQQAAKIAPAAPAAVRKSTAAAPVSVAQAPTAAAPTSSRASLGQIDDIVDEGRGIAKRVIRIAERNRPGSSATAAQRAAYELRRSNAQLARRYDENLAAVKASARGARTDSEANGLVKQASQTRAYLRFLEKQSTDSLKR